MLEKNEHNKYNTYTKILVILNAKEPFFFVRSQEPSVRLSCIQLWRHGCASNVKKVGETGFSREFCLQKFY